LDEHRGEGGPVARVDCVVVVGDQLLDGEDVVGLQRHGALLWSGATRAATLSCASSILSLVPIRSRAMADTTDTVSVERIIPAAPEKIFDLLADPARHRDIDGSGTVRDAKSGSQRLTLGSTFGMSMKMGIPYS